MMNEPFTMELQSMPIQSLAHKLNQRTQHSVSQLRFKNKINTNPHNDLPEMKKVKAFYHSCGYFIATSLRVS
jgi:hypothetical protein